MVETEEPYKAWQILYPIYLDVTKSQAMGRRIAKEFALTNPTANELEMALRALNIPCHLEADKRHCATPRVMGRVRFLLKNPETSALYNADIDNKQTLLLSIAVKIADARKLNALTAKPAAATQAGKGNKKRK
eukprot:UN03270